MAKNGQSDTEKLNTDETKSDLNSLYDAINTGDQEAVARLMADEQPDPKDDDKDNETPETTEEEDDTPDPDGQDVEDEDNTEEKPDESKPDSAPKPEAAKPAASTDNAVDEVTRLKSEIEELKQQAHRYQSDAGRVPFLQRRLADLEKQARSSTRPVTQVTANTKFTADDYKNVELDPDTQKEIDDLKEVDPTMAKVIERTAKTAILTAQSRMEAAFQQREQIQSDVDSELFYVEQKARLAQMVPQHEEIFKSPHWQEWKSTLTPGQRALAESGYAEDVVQAIHSFAAAMQQKFPQAVQQGTPASGDQTPPVSQPSEVAIQRNRKAASPDVKGPAAKPSETFDEDAYFQEMYNKVGKSEHILK